MKTRSWTRVLSLLLTVAMIATLLVVPAAAALDNTSDNVWYAESKNLNGTAYKNNAVTKGIFTLFTGADASNSKGTNSYDGTSLTWGLKFNSSAYATIKPTANGTLKAIFRTADANGVSELTNVTDTGATTVDLDANGIGTYTLVANKEYKLTYKSTEKWLLGLVFVPSTPTVTYKATVANDITGGTVKL